MPEAASVSSELEENLGRLFRSEPYCFEFFQAVRLLQRLSPERELVGRFADPSKEVLRFHARVASEFPASEIQELTLRTGAPHSMVVNFMGLVGPLGVLPLYYTELVMQRVRAKDTALRDFLDIFNHRIISLFYQAWEKYHFSVTYERERRDPVSHYLLDLVGLGTKGLQRRQAVADETFIYYSGLFGLRTRPAQGLKQVIEDYFDVPVAVEQFVGGWWTLDRPSQCRLEGGTSYAEQLGIGAVVGDEVWDPQSSVRVVLGPLPLRQYLDFLPNGTAYAPLRDLLWFYGNGRADFEVRLVLRREDVPECELGSVAEAAPQLGWCTWVKSAPFGRDPGDTILRM